MEITCIVCATKFFLYFFSEVLFVLHSVRMSTEDVHVARIFIFFISG
jgi:hypothetical protein